MTKLGQGSKKKARKAAFLKRQEKRKGEIDFQKRWLESVEKGNIEETAKLMGIRLR